MRQDRILMISASQPRDGRNSKHCQALAQITLPIIKSHRDAFEPFNTHIQAFNALNFALVTGQDFGEKKPLKGCLKSKT